MSEAEPLLKSGMRHVRPSSSPGARPLPHCRREARVLALRVRANSGPMAAASRTRGRGRQRQILTTGKLSPTRASSRAWRWTRWPR